MNTFLLHTLHVPKPIIGIWRPFLKVIKGTDFELISKLMVNKHTILLENL